MSDILFSSALQLATAIREGAVSAADVLEVHLAHIARHNPALNAIVTLDETGARQRAQEADAALARGEIWGPLHGVPVTIKDALETAGLRTTSSFKPLANYVPTRDATVVARLRDAGAVIVGKTNMPMLAMDGQSDSPIFGRANNPWDVGRTPGGSTGGGAAAVASGMSPLELGSDIAGSVRIPAHYCGMFSLKPSDHLVPLAGHIPELPGSPRGVRHMGVIGPLARSVADLRLALTLIAGPDGRDWEVPPVSLEAPPPRLLKDCRFAWSDEFGQAPVTADTRSALQQLARQLSQQGCFIEKGNPPEFDFEAAWRAWGEVFGTEIGAAMPAVPRMLTSLQFRTAGKGWQAMQGATRGLALNTKRYVAALTLRDALIASLEQFLARYDGWLCPVTSTPAITHRKTGALIEVDGRKIPYHMGQLAYTCIFNLTGHPVVTLPLARSADGLPIGVQLVGRRWQEMALLNTAEAIAEVIGPFQRPPGY
ncbi:MAG: amidase [Chloroflexi bacterium]|nr:amidase [Chloroflexota bacterium]MCI0576644.1 amidase [Chloroflexota bacterium]MCI0646988.1 amidase [Chloroflexota bacterium]MCI0730688.1 amidase [Chloroflexota bacterium]